MINNRRAECVFRVFFPENRDGYQEEKILKQKIGLRRLIAAQLYVWKVLAEAIVATIKQF
jgi:hypothetical protein